MTITPIKLQSAALDERESEIVAHGWLDVEALKALRVGDYQREVIDSRYGKVSSLRKAVEANARLPDIMLGMRGEKFTSKGNAMILEEPIFIVDGLQRVSALLKYAIEYPERAKNIRIGAEVRFDTTRDSEAALFTVLNVHRKAMSPSVILRNERHTSDGVLALYGLSNSDKNFALAGRVCWNQQMHRGDLCTAMAFAKVAMTLHRHAASGGRNISNPRLVPSVLNGMAKAVGLQNFRNNISTLYDALDEIWGIRGIKFTDRSTHTRQNFMIQFAGVISDHEDFWDGNKLMIDGSTKAKLRTFPMADPTITRLAGAGATAGIILYRYLVDHINKHRKGSSHLTLRRIGQTRAGKKRIAA
jgi:hypothetical protein